MNTEHFEQDVRQHISSCSKEISNEVGNYLGMTFDPKALDLIAELTYRKLSLYGADLEAFQKHSKRSTINTDDVKLLVRRNESLTKMVNEKIQSLENKGSPEIKEKIKAVTQ
ncbi:centromere protein S-like [Euwallacea similis]|uniref:centromere protein S-like n=1 Tax=Euwallacea similis TaxID=1736056 RepID=UPI00344D2841